MAETNSGNSTTSVPGQASDRVTIDPASFQAGEVPRGGLSGPAQRLMCSAAIVWLIAMYGLLRVAYEAPPPHSMQYFVPAQLGLALLGLCSLIVVQFRWLSSVRRGFVAVMGVVAVVSALGAERLGRLLGDFTS